MDSKQAGASYAKLVAIRNAPPSARALLRKLTPNPNNPSATASGTKTLDLNRYAMERVTNQTAQDVRDSDSIMQMLPDLELAEQILVGSILSPKDMSTADISFQVADGQFESQLAAPMIDVISNHFKHDYKIDERLDLQLEQIITTKGAYVVAVLPENNVDVIINGRPNMGLEDFKRVVNRMQENKPLGILGHPITPGIALESFNGAWEDVSALRDKQGNKVAHVTITDNFNVLKTADYRRRSQRMAINTRIQKMTASMEQATQDYRLTDKQIDQLYEGKRRGSSTVEVVTPQAYMNNPSVGHPLALDLPVDCLVPITIPGKPEEHVCYVVLLDLHGRPLSRSDNADHYEDMRRSFQSNSKDNSSELIRLTREALGADSNTANGFEVEQIQNAYTALLENDVQNRLRNGLYDEELEIGFTEEVTRVMLYRKFKEMGTQMLVIPAELVTYIAFNYNKDGVGQTMLAKSKILSNMRSVLMFAETMAGVRNAVGRKKVNIQLDPRDPDKMDTLYKIQELVLETARNAFPISSPDPGQSLNYLTRAAFDFAINNDGEDFGQTRVEYDDYNTSVQAGNPELQDRLRRMQVAAWGVPPEKVDPTASPDFAVGVVQNDLIMTRRVKRYQRIFCQGQTKFVRNYTRNSSILVNRLLTIVNEQKDQLTGDYKNKTPDEIVELFIDAVEARLPEPDTTRIDLMLQAFQQFSELLEQGMEAYITPDLFPDDAAGGAAGAADRFKAIVKAHFKRQYMAQNNILPELAVLHEIDNDQPVFNITDMQNLSNKTLAQGYLQFLENERKNKEEFEKKFPNVTNGAGGGFEDTPPSPEGGEADFNMDTPAGDDPLGEPEAETPEGDELNLDDAAAAVDNPADNLTDPGETPPAEDETPPTP